MNPYFEQKILNADPIELVRLVYQRAIACVREAREHLRGGRIAERSRAISRAYEALRELLESLRPDAAPELAENLRKLYCYMQRRLLDGNVQQADAPLTEVLALLTTLAEAWNRIGDQAVAKEEKPAAWEQGGWAGKTAASGVFIES